MPPLSFASDASEKTLSEQGVTWYQAAPGTDALVCSTPERAMLELCDGVADAASVYEADALMQAMTRLRPQWVSLLLRHCRSIKAKRVFLALAEEPRFALKGGTAINLFEQNKRQKSRVSVEWESGARRDA